MNKMHGPAVGTTPPGTTNEEQASRWVQDMFVGVAPNYDRLNHILSFNIDRLWRRRLMRRLSPVLERPDAKVLDLCCGTGDVLLDFQAVSANVILGADFCHPMLVTAGQKARAKGFQAPLFEADALRMPIADEALDAIAVSFGFRNLVSYRGGLEELLRMLKPGGTAAILEFSHPKKAFMKASYGLYSSFLLPVVGRVLSGSTEAYQYLPDSIKKFPEAEKLREMMVTAGFTHAGYELLTGGIAALHIGRK